MDFYIASKVGEIFDIDRNAKIAIISADNGFQAVLDYWRPRLPVQNQLVICKTIAKSLICVNGEGARKRLVNQNMAVLELQTVIAPNKPKILYLTSLKSFGRKNGTEVYRKIKNSAISV